MDNYDPTAVNLMAAFPLPGQVDAYKACVSTCDSTACREPAPALGLALGHYECKTRTVANFHDGNQVGACRRGRRPQQQAEARSSWDRRPPGGQR